MGQKTNPNSLRTGITKGWHSNWVATNPKDYAAYVKQDFQIRDYLRNNYPKELLGDILISRTLKIITIVLQTPRPAVLVGGGGELIEKHTKALKKKCGSDVQIQVRQLKKPDLSARIVAEIVASKIAGRMHYRRAARQSIGNIMRMGAWGCKIQISGRLLGAEMARTESFGEGRLPLNTLRADIDYALATAKTNYGIIGVKVFICRGEVFGKRDLSLNVESRYSAAGPAPSRRSKSYPKAK